MTNDLWISESGDWSEAELLDRVTKYCGKYSAETRYFMALFVDRFVCARIDRLETALRDSAVKGLLELRVFDARRELWAHRSMLGKPFAWRIADDDVLKVNANNWSRNANEAQPSDVETTDKSIDKLAAFFKKPENYYMESTQLLDIDTVHVPNDAPEYGGKKLRSTGGSVYELPIQDEQAVQLVSYIRYDGNGIANVVDYRLKGFCKLEQADDAKGGERQ